MPYKGAADRELRVSTRRWLICPDAGVGARCELGVERETCTEDARGGSRLPLPAVGRVVARGHPPRRPVLFVLPSVVDRSPANLISVSVRRAAPTRLDPSALISLAVRRPDAAGTICFEQSDCCRSMAGER